MNSSRMLSLNEISSEFSVEELEPRLEMQMLGIGTDPHIIFTRTGTWIIILPTSTGTWII
jgi:hypothetical protein